MGGDDSRLALDALSSWFLPHDVDPPSLDLTATTELLSGLSCPPPDLRLIRTLVASVVQEGSVRERR